MPICSKWQIKGGFYETTFCSPLFDASAPSCSGECSGVFRLVNPREPWING